MIWYVWQASHVSSQKLKMNTINHQIDVGSISMSEMKRISNWYNFDLKWSQIQILKNKSHLTSPSLTWQFGLSIGSMVHRSRRSECHRSGRFWRNGRHDFRLDFVTGMKNICKTDKWEIFLICHMILLTWLTRNVLEIKACLPSWITSWHQTSPRGKYWLTIASPELDTCYFVTATVWLNRPFENN